MWPIVLLFVGVFLLNLIPAFAPPTWMVFSFIGFRSAHSSNVALLAVVGAMAATLGRLTLAKLARVIIRRKFLSEETKQNIDSIRKGLEGKRRLTFSVFLFYAFTPLPSNYLFLAYGLTTMDLWLIGVPFFLGRSISYGLWGLTSSAVSRRIAMESTQALSYLSAYFIASQILLLYLIYLFTRIDWRAVFAEKKLRWIPRKTKATPPPAQQEGPGEAER
jgi:membrane protein DedA with SNARE-associated domain